MVRFSQIQLIQLIQKGVEYRAENRSRTRARTTVRFSQIQSIHWWSKPEKQSVGGEHRAENRVTNRPENMGENRGQIQSDSGICQGVRLSQRTPHLSDFGEKLRDKVRQHFCRSWPLRPEFSESPGYFGVATL